jgi:hypothetical protein
MKINYLDKEIEFLEELEVNGELIPLEVEKLKEFKEIKQKLILQSVGCSLISEEEFNTMANDYIKLECHEYDGFDIKAKRFQDYRNGLKNMYKVLK